VAENHAQTATTAGVEHVRAYKIRPKDVLCDAYGNAIGVVAVTAHPSPVDYDKTSEFTVELPGGDELPAGVRVWRKFQR
jgi:hypothetical protein